MNEITTTTATTSLLAVLTLICVAGALIALVIVHLLPSGVNPVSEAVSDYGAGKYRNYYRAAAFWLGSAGLLTAAALGLAVFPKPTLTILTLLVFAAARWAITIFPTDPPGAPPTDTGRYHVVLAALAFASIAVAAGVFHTSVARDPFWKPYAGTLTFIGYAVIVTAVGTALTRRAVFTRFFGLVERLLYVSMFAWFTAVSAILLRG